MATNQVVMRINLRENTNSKSEQYGNLYPYIDRVNTISQRGLCEHIAESDTVFGRAVIDGVVTIFSQTIFDYLSMGVAVQLNGIGTFYPTVVSREGGVADEAEAVRIGADELVKGIHVRFLPDSTKLDNITSKKFKERCSLQLHMRQHITHKVVEGKKVTIYNYTPINQANETQEDKPTT